MSRPVLFVIDDDAGVVHALRDDLGRRFGEDFPRRYRPSSRRLARSWARWVLLT